LALQLPVLVLKIDSIPKLMAGGVPVPPINLILARKRQFQLAPDTTLASFASAAQYYVEFCAHSGAHTKAGTGRRICGYHDYRFFG